MLSRFTRGLFFSHYHGLGSVWFWFAKLHWDRQGSTRRPLFFFILFSSAPPRGIGLDEQQALVRLPLFFSFSFILPGSFVFSGCFLTFSPVPGVFQFRCSSPFHVHFIFCMEFSLFIVLLATSFWVAFVLLFLPPQFLSFSFSSICLLVSMKTRRKHRNANALHGCYFFFFLVWWLFSFVQLSILFYDLHSDHSACLFFFSFFSFVDSFFFFFFLERFLFLYL